MSTEEGFAGEVKASRQRTKASFFPVIIQTFSRRCCPNQRWVFLAQKIKMCLHTSKIWIWIRSRSAHSNQAKISHRCTLQFWVLGNSRCSQVGTKNGHRKGQPLKLLRGGQDAANSGAGSSLFPSWSTAPAQAKSLLHRASASHLLWEISLPEQKSRFACAMNEYPSPGWNVVLHRKLLYTSLGFSGHCGPLNIMLF